MVLLCSITGNNNVFLGKLAGNQSVTSTCNLNTALGVASLSGLTVGLCNVAVGAQCLQQVTSSSNNTAVGFNALKDTSNTFSNNTAIGNNSGTGAFGSFMTFVGHGAQQTATTDCSGSSAFGQNAKITKAQQVVIGDISGVNECQLAGALSLPTATLITTEAQGVYPGARAPPSLCQDMMRITVNGKVYCIALYNVT
jgi:hypothetical protein